ncbi:MAG: serine/threonine-protein kinase [Polyangiaceae bacterium]
MKKVEQGELVAARYRVEETLGEGGAGYVVRAKDELTGDKVALKFLLESVANDPEMVERFRREASAAAQIKSEHAIRIHEVQTLEEGLHYMVMELLAGMDLDQLIAERTRLEVSEAVDMVLQACEAVAEAHSLKIVHRDLKPANLFVTQREGKPHVKVLDFGISKVKDSSAKLTRTASVLGSPEFMPPEQLQGAKFVDARSDLWALGVILYEAVTGKLPFPGNNIGTLTLQIVTMQPDPPEKHREEIPLGLSAVILRCLEKKSTQRWQSIVELAEALAPFGSEAAATSVENIKRAMPAAPVYSIAPPPSLVPSAPKQPIAKAQVPVIVAAPAAVAQPQSPPPANVQPSRVQPAPTEEGKTNWAVIAVVTLITIVIVGFALSQMKGGQKGKSGLNVVDPTPNEPAFSPYV